MTKDCLSILQSVGPMLERQIEPGKGEATPFASYNAGGNKFPEDIEANNPSIEEFRIEYGNWKRMHPRDVPTKRKYLWIVSDETIRLILEKTQNPESERGCVVHTNITAGKPARIGGELWFVREGLPETTTVYFNFKSGRYPPGDVAKQKDVIIALLKCVGYREAKFIEDEI